jgi:hypothetical protein
MVLFKFQNQSDFRKLLDNNIMYMDYRQLQGGRSMDDDDDVQMGPQKKNRSP